MIWYFEGLVSKCKYYTNPVYEFKDYVKLSEIPGAQTDSYQARVEFYAQGTRNAHVLLSPTSKPNLLTDAVYEFGKFQEENKLYKLPSFPRIRAMKLICVTPPPPSQWSVAGLTRECWFGEWKANKRRLAKSLCSIQWHLTPRRSSSWKFRTVNTGPIGFSIFKAKHISYDNFFIISRWKRAHIQRTW